MISDKYLTYDYFIILIIYYLFFFSELKKSDYDNQFVGGTGNLFCFYNIIDKIVYI